VREDNLEEEFSKFGKIKNVDLRKHRGFAFVEFGSSEEASAAVKSMDGKKIDSQRILV